MERPRGLNRKVLVVFGIFAIVLFTIILNPSDNSSELSEIVSRNYQLRDKIKQLEETILRYQTNQIISSSPKNTLCEAAWKSKYSLNCNVNCDGNCFLGKCYCRPGWGPFNNCTKKQYNPPQCQPVITPHGPKGADDCFYNPQYGIGEVSMDRWKAAQKAEAQLWESFGASDDRADYHSIYFDRYKSLPDDLGDTLETGCGPYTQIKTIMKYGKKPSKLTLTDPGMINYIQRVASCPYKNGILDGIHTTLMNIGSEELNFYEKFDTVIMINVIEHVWNAFDVFEAVFRSLKPNGLFIFQERILFTEAPTQLYHPIRLNMQFYEQFLNYFDVIYRFNGTTGQMIAYYYEIPNEIYFVGRKKPIL